MKSKNTFRILNPPFLMMGVKKYLENKKEAKLLI